VPSATSHDIGTGIDAANQIEPVMIGRIEDRHHPEIFRPSETMR
jgi:hypothetical protein